MQRIVHIDRPTGILIQNFKQIFVGWIALSDGKEFDALRVEVGGIPVELVWTEREDVAVRFPQLTTRGWAMQFEFDGQVHNSKTIAFDVLLYGKCIYRRRFLKSRSLAGPERGSPLFFMHVPKAAGTALRQFVDHVFQDLPTLFVYDDFPGVAASSVEHMSSAFRDSRELVFGHIGFDFIEGLHAKDPKVVMLLREPKKLIESYRRFATKPDLSFFDNPYVRHLAGTPHSLPYGEVTHTHFELAKKKLEKYVYPLRVEQLQLFADEVTDAFQLPRFLIPMINNNSGESDFLGSDVTALLQYDTLIYQAQASSRGNFLDFLEN
ncbi:MAG: hypothetical protein ABJB01_06710 [Rudaea sp.]